jgi:methionyl-tRNA formyltransferase
MRLVFAGTPAVAIPTLETLAAAHEVVAVVSRDDAPQGRRRVLTPSPVAARAAELGLRVIKANRLGDEVTAEIQALRPELGVIVAYGGFVRQPLLSTPRLGWINLHFSLLPRWRGAAPVQWSIMGGDEFGGASVFQLVPEMDAGPLFAQASQRIGAHETAGHLLESLSVSGAELTASVVAELEAGTAQSTEQQGDVTLAPKLLIDHARIDWTANADEVYRRIRGVTPEPGAFTLLSGDSRLKVLEAAPARHAAPLTPGSFGLDGDGRVLVGTASTPLELLRVQPAGKTAMAAADWWRGQATTEGLSAE